MLYLYDETLCLVDEVNEAGIVFNQLPNPVHVVEGDEKYVSWPRTESDLVLKRHGHQVIQLEMSSMDMDMCGYTT